MGSYDFKSILRWRLLAGSHNHPGPDGGTCILEMCLVTAGEPYRPIADASEMPECCCYFMSKWLLVLNDILPDAPRQRLVRPMLRLYGSANPMEIPKRRCVIAAGVVQKVLPMLLDNVGLDEVAGCCRGTPDLVASHVLRKVTAILRDREKMLKPYFDTPTECCVTNTAACLQALINHQRGDNAVRTATLAGVVEILMHITGKAFDIGRQAEPVAYDVVNTRLHKAKEARL